MRFRPISSSTQKLFVTKKTNTPALKSLTADKPTRGSTRAELHHKHKSYSDVSTRWQQQHTLARSTSAVGKQSYATVPIRLSYWALSGGCLWLSGDKLQVLSTADRKKKPQNNSLIKEEEKKRVMQ